MLLSSPLQAFLSAALVREEAHSLPVRRLGMGGAGLCCGVAGHGTEPGPDSGARPCSFSVWVGNTSHVLPTLLGPYRLQDIYCPQDYLVFLRNPDSLASFLLWHKFPRGECDWLPLLPSEGRQLIDLAALGQKSKKRDPGKHMATLSTV